jgi:hypothetical protein
VLDDGEDYEGCLVTLPFVKVVQRFPASKRFPRRGSVLPDTIFVENLILRSIVVPATLGHVISVTGVVHYSGGSFRIVPRAYSDIVDGVTGVGRATVGWPGLANRRRARSGSRCRRPRRSASP